MCRQAAKWPASQRWQLAIANFSVAAAVGAGAVPVRPVSLCWPSALKRYQ